MRRQQLKDFSRNFPIGPNLWSTNVTESYFRRQWGVELLYSTVLTNISFSSEHSVEEKFLITTSIGMCWPGAKPLCGICAVSIISPPSPQHRTFVKRVLTALSTGCWKEKKLFNMSLTWLDFLQTYPVLSVYIQIQRAYHSERLPEDIIESPRSVYC